ncbi:hypothetical protein AB4851_28705 [Burkholderia sp. 22PA0099]|uniref:hypothetical protein n=1 Tax=Burkholderia sp. 22PA0099 TaxID=3237372 RepID=UPI0039C194F3
MIRRVAFSLAGAATTTAICMSVLASWQRGGWLLERIAWVAIGVVLVAGAHVLPALYRSAPLAVRAVGTLLWLGCMAAASFGHATFFLLSQSHAGNARVSTLVDVKPVAHRSLTAVISERASITAQLAQANVHRCVGDCPVLRARRTGLTARLNALDAEASDVRRDQAAEDRAEIVRDTTKADPVTTRLAAVLGMATTKLDLLVGLALAAILEATACLLWWVVFLPRADSVTEISHDAVTLVASEQLGPTTTAPTVQSETPPPAPVVMEPDTDLTRLVRDIQAGILKPTVASIRRHLHCSQAKAVALRRQFIEHNAKP